MARIPFNVSAKTARLLKEKFNSWFKVTIDAVEMDKRKRKKENIGNIIQNSISKWKSVQNNKIDYVYIENEEIDIRCFPFDFETSPIPVPTTSPFAFLLSVTPCLRIFCGSLLKASHNPGPLSLYFI